MKTTLIVPTYNEIETVPHTLPRIKKDLVDEIIIVDNNSTDGTIEWCRGHGYTVVLQKSPGYGNGIREALRVATGDTIIEFPPDGSSSGERIPALVKKISEGYELSSAS